MCRTSGIMSQATVLGAAKCVPLDGSLYSRECAEHTLFIKKLEGMVKMNLVEKEFLNFMKKFDANPFQIVMNGETHLIGEGNPTFKVIFHKIPNVSEMLTSTSIALGEAYMHGDIEN